MAINGIALTSVAAGSILVWSGIKGWNVTKTVGELITGTKPSGSEQYVLTNASGASSGSGGGAIPSNSAIANDAQKYIGHAYTYGGAPGKDGKSNWDCSSFVNWVVGHDLHGSIPGYPNGSYDGSAHGPPTGSWAIWPGMQHLNANQVQAGDILVWNGHMGIAVSSSQCVSALNSQLGTRITSIASTHSGTPIYGRLK